MKTLIFALLITATLAAAQAKRTFTGTITDNMCPTGDHSRMRMGSTDGECTVACVAAHGALYVLYDGKEDPQLPDLKIPQVNIGLERDPGTDHFEIKLRAVICAAGQAINANTITLLFYFRGNQVRITDS